MRAPLGDGFEVVRYRCIELHRSLARWADDNFLHVQVGRVKQTAALARGEHHDGVRFTSCTQIGSLERVHGNIHFGILAAFVSRSSAHLFTDEQHGSFITLAFADHDCAVHSDGIHFRAHGFDGHLVGLMAVSKAHCVRGGDRGTFDDAQKFQAECFFHARS
jgi:hypothetical protein